MARNVYVDTSVVGGYFDDEFEFWTKIFFESVKKGEFTIVISELLTQELRLAPHNIGTLLEMLPEESKLYIEFDKEAEKLATSYINN